MPYHIWRVLTTFHSNPTVWWIGQLVSYIFRPTASLTEVRAPLPRSQRPVDARGLTNPTHARHHTSQYFDNRRASLGWMDPVVGYAPSFAYPWVIKGSDR